MNFTKEIPLNFFSQKKSSPNFSKFQPQNRQVRHHFFKNSLHEGVFENSWKFLQLVQTFTPITNLLCTFSSCSDLSIYLNYNIYKFHQIWRTVSDLPPPPAIPSPPHLTEMSDVQTDLDRRCTAPWFLWIWVVGQAYVFGRLDEDDFFNGMGRRRGFWQFFRKKINLEILSHHFQMLEIIPWLTFVESSLVPRYRRPAG